MRCVSRASRTVLKVCLKLERRLKVAEQTQQVQALFLFIFDDLVIVIYCCLLSANRICFLHQKSNKSQFKAIFKFKAEKCKIVEPSSLQGYSKKRCDNFDAVISHGRKCTIYCSVYGSTTSIFMDNILRSLGLVHAGCLFVYYTLPTPNIMELSESSVECQYYICHISTRALCEQQ